MTERQQLNAWVKEHVISEFRDFVSDEEGQIYGEFGRHVESALEEYMDGGRYARIEEDTDEILAKLDEVLERIQSESGHKHKAHVSDDERLPRGMPRPEKAEVVIGSIREDHEDTVRHPDLVRTVKRMVGADDRTVDGLLDEIKAQRLAYKLPDGDLWLFDEEAFINAIRNLQFVTDEKQREYEEHDRRDWESYVANSDVCSATIDDLCDAYGWSESEFNDLIREARERKEAGRAKARTDGGVADE